jgi:hypothetical protein
MQRNLKLTLPLGIIISAFLVLFSLPVDAAVSAQISIVNTIGTVGAGGSITVQCSVKSRTPEQPHKHLELARRLSKIQ